MITTFGEILLRISPKHIYERLIQANEFRIEPGGSESNVAIALSNLGLKTNFVTCLPENQLSQNILQHLKQFGVETKYIVKKSGRIGIYWTEIGSGPRNSFVLYDRDNSVFSLSNFFDYDWDSILKETTWFHFSGISPALNQSLVEHLERVINKINSPYSVDLNYRNQLWNWTNKDKTEINKVMTSLCKNAIFLSGNETDFQNVLGIENNDSDIDKRFSEIATKCFSIFNKTKYIGISNRISYSGTQNDWNGYLFVRGERSFYKGITYRLDSINDRVGTGDSFTAGIIYCLNNKNKFNYQETIDFAVTLSSLNHTIRGDASRFSKEDVIAVIKTKANGRIIR